MKRIKHEYIKPIFIIGVPYASMADIEKISKELDISNINDDYHILVISVNHDNPFFKVFYEKDFNEIKYKELKNIVKSQIEHKPIPD